MELMHLLLWHIVTPILHLLYVQMRRKVILSSIISALGCIRLPAQLSKPLFVFSSEESSHVVIATGRESLLNPIIMSDGCFLSITDDGLFIYFIISEVPVKWTDPSVSVLWLQD